MLALLLAAAGLAAEPPKPPLVVLLDGDAKAWQGWTEAAGWRFLSPWTNLAEKSIDLRIKALEAKIAEAAKQAPVDEGRIYLAAQGEGVPALFYVASRMPDLWAAAVALGGTPRPAIDSNRLYAANTTLVPVLWLFADKAQETLAQRMKAAGYNLEWKVEPAANPQQILEWLAARRRDEFPASIDCETGTPAFPRCYWIEVTKFDAGAAERRAGFDARPAGGLGRRAGPRRFRLGPRRPRAPACWFPGCPRTTRAR